MKFSCITVNVRYLLLALTFLLVGCSQQQSNTPSETLEQASTDSAMEHALKHLDSKYVCPMHPQIVRDEPGTCPICGMNLVEKTIESQTDKYPVVEISHAVTQSMGIRTETVKTDTMWKFIRTVGRVDYDETTLTHIHPRTEGWIEKLEFRAEGEPVSKGEKLADLYSPEILSAQLDYLVAIEQASNERRQKARNRLRLLGVTESTINQIAKHGESQNTTPIHATSSGIMTKLLAREGMYIKPEMEIFTIADLSRIWVWVDIFEHQIDWLQTGLNAEITVPAYPGRKWEGKLDYIYPALDPDSRTLRARLVFDNPDYLLKANMFAEVTIYGGPKHDVMVIPSEALIETGERTTVVRLLDDGRFQPVDVVTGIQRNGRSEILNGLKIGDRIVTSGQFLIDSESSLKASFLRMTEGE